jgi:hypothetical protein
VVPGVDRVTTQVPPSVLSAPAPSASLSGSPPPPPARMPWPWMLAAALAVLLATAGLTVLAGGLATLGVAVGLRSEPVEDVPPPAATDPAPVGAGVPPPAATAPAPVGAGVPPPSATAPAPVGAGVPPAGSEEPAAATAPAPVGAGVPPAGSEEPAAATDPASSDVLAGTWNGRVDGRAFVLELTPSETTIEGSLVLPAASSHHVEALHGTFDGRALDLRSADGRVVFQGTYADGGMAGQYWLEGRKPLAWTATR